MAEEARIVTMKEMRLIETELAALKDTLADYEKGLLPPEQTMYGMGKRIANLEKEVKILLKPVNAIAKGFGRWDLDEDVRCDFACQEALRELKEHREKT